MLAMSQLVWVLIFVAVSGINAEVTQNNDDVDIIDRPYVVSIRKRGEHVCSGAILDEDHIVTSDRCVPRFKHSWNVMNDITVVSGTSSLKPGGERLFVKEMFSQNHYINPANNPVTSGLAVIKLGRSLKLDEKVQPIPLSETELPLNAELQMVGWMTDRQGKKTTNLKEIKLKTIDLQECQSSHEKKLTESEICTKPESESDYCQGDSGSPLIYEGKLIGVTTFGISCNDVPVPDVHQSIYKNLEYLNKIINP